MRRGLVSEVIDFFTLNDAYKPEMRRAFLQFRKKDLLYDDNFKKELPDEEMKLFIDWFLFDFKLKNRKTPIKTFYLINYLDFKENDKENYKHLLRTTYSF
jgi:hypothetical protein